MFKHPRVDETVSHPEITDAKKTSTVMISDKISTKTMVSPKNQNSWVQKNKALVLEDDEITP